jgi:hypothetical protein
VQNLQTLHSPKEQTERNKWNATKHTKKPAVFCKYMTDEEEKTYQFNILRVSALKNIKITRKKI